MNTDTSINPTQSVKTTDVRELQEMIEQRDQKIASLRTDVQSFKELARCNREEADALRRAGGVACDDTVKEGIAKVQALRELLDALQTVPIHRLDETPEAFIERFKTWYRDVRNPAIAKAEGN